MACRAVVAAAVALAACGAADSSIRSPAPPADAAVELAALLPDGVDRCVVVRPGSLTDRRRSLVLLHSLAEPIAWEPHLPVVAYAMALAEANDGRRARRTFVRLAVTVPEDRVRDALGVRWLDEPCEGEACRRPVARWLDGRTLEIARHEWPRHRLPRSSATCVRLARAQPSAIEIAADRTGSIGLVQLSGPRPSIRILTVERGTLVTRREVELDDPIEARIVEARLGLRGPWMESTLLPLAPAQHRVDRDGERLAVVESRRWEELELALEDERLRRRALRMEDRRHGEPVPLGRVRFESLESVRHQVELRRAELARLAPDARARAATELASLLERARQAHPAEIELARLLVRLCLDVLDDATRARAVADDVLARGLADDHEGWRALRRESLARVSTQDLATALIADAIADPADAPRAAADLRALGEIGVPYDWSESAWRLSRDSFERPMARRPAEARLPFEGLLAALVGWARLEGAARNATVQVAIRSSARSESRALGESRPEVLAFRARDGGTVYVGALASPEMIALRQLGAALAHAIEPSALEVAIALRDPRGHELVRVQLGGTLAGDTFVVEHTGPELASAGWSILGRYLAQPLAELPTALFPPPTLTVRAESAEVAAELRRRLERTDPGACRAAGPMLRCVAPGRPEQLGEIALRITAERLRGGFEHTP